MLRTSKSLLLASVTAIFVLTSLAASAGPKELQVGKTYHGFKLEKKQEIDEINSLALLFSHKRSGARLLKLENDDDNKTFCISFKTLPDTDSGIPHITEHSVLNGSRKFPVKSPFDILMKGSLNTFLNAMTSSDFTMYPVASRNTKDFFNLMNVYLDAVLHPRIYDEPKIFMQEGWHLSLAEKSAELSYNGVVYNEMKGAFSSPTRLLDWKVYKKLFPGNTYGVSSGGHPDFIPELTYEKFLAFHKKYYHPSNSYITLYGDGNTLAELKYINDNYLKEFKRKKIDATVPLQKAFKELGEVSLDYPVAAGEETKDKTFLSLNIVAGGSTQPHLSMALDILTSVLVDLPAAPVRRALQDAGIGKDVYASFDEIKQGVFSIVVKNANPADKDKFKQVVYDTLRKVAKEGLDKKAVEGVINRLEFRLREADWGSFPKGLVYTYFSLSNWMFMGDPLVALEYDKLLEKLRSALSSRYLEEIIEKHLLDNPHALLAVARPKPGLEDENTKRLAEKLAEKKKSMSDAELAKLVEQTKALKAYQEAPDDPEDIKKIPLLSLEDIEPETERLDVEEKEVAGAKVLHFAQPTNGIIYLQLMFDTRTVPQELIPLLPVLAHVLGDLDTDKHTYGELDTELNIHTGGLSFSTKVYEDFKDPEAYYPKFVARSKVLVPKFEKLVELEGEVIAGTRFGDIGRMKQVLGEINSRLQSMARRGGYYLSYLRMESYLSESGKYVELTQGLSQIGFVSDIYEMFGKRPGDIIADLDLLADVIFSKGNLVIGVTCSKDDYNVFEKNLPALIDRLGGEKYESQKYSFDFDTRNEGLVTASKVQYVNKGADYRQLGHPYSGKLNVLRKILSSDYLQEKVRVQGGAYGAWATFSQDGVGAMSSYRDPNLKKTLDNFENSIEYLEKFSADDREMTRYIIGTIAGKDRPKTPAGKGRAAISYYLRHIDHADRQKERDEILKTNQEDIRKLGKLVKDVLKNGVICVYGNEKVLKDNKDLFDKLVDVIK